MGARGLPALLATAVAATAAAASGVDLTSQLRVPPLGGDQALLVGTFRWNDEVVIEVLDRPHVYGARQAFRTVDLFTGSIEPLECPGAGRVLDLADSPGGSFALCGGRLGPRLYSVDDERWTRVDRPKRRWRARHYRICASPSTLFLFAPGTIYHRAIEGGAWTETRFVSSARRSSGSFSYAEHLLATESAIYAGYDRGEWGGGAEKIRIRDRGDRLDFVPAGSVTEDNVRGIVSGADGTVWIAAGNSHLSLSDAGLFRIDAHGTVPLVLQPFRSDPAGRFALPGDTDLSGIALGPQGFPYVLATAFGVFEATDAELRPLVSADLAIEYPDERWGSHVRIHSGPVGMVVLEDGTIVVATRSTGLLVFEPWPEGYTVRQVLVRPAH